MGTYADTIAARWSPARLKETILKISTFSVVYNVDLSFNINITPIWSIFITVTKKVFNLEEHLSDISVIYQIYLLEVMTWFFCHNSYNVP